MVLFSTYLSHVIQTNVCFIVSQDLEKIFYGMTLVSYNRHSSENFLISYSLSILKGKKLILCALYHLACK